MDTDNNTVVTIIGIIILTAVVFVLIAPALFEGRRIPPKQNGKTAP
ncbi:MAG: hypothetical protein PHW24_01085 [Candidatus Moranbacteria bacterium]|nr:hypothetical protein [Candidatus Moranbacteria bacterium]